MKKRLTLTVDDRVVKAAKAHANSTGKSLSNLVETYLETLAVPGKRELSAKLGRIAGAVRLPVDFDESVDLRAYFEIKHM